MHKKSQIFCIFVYIIIIILYTKQLQCYKLYTNYIQTVYKMRKANTKEIDAIFWLTGKMSYNKTYQLNESQQQIIKDIFIISGIQLPVEPNKAYDYWFDIAEDWSTIKKVKNC